jgi:hypothetical protein
MGISLRITDSFGVVVIDLSQKASRCWGQKSMKVPALAQKPFGSRFPAFHRSKRSALRARKNEGWGLRTAQSASGRGCGKYSDTACPTKAGPEPPTRSDLSYGESADRVKQPPYVRAPGYCALTTAESHTWRNSRGMLAVTTICCRMSRRLAAITSASVKIQGQSRRRPLVGRR